MKKVIVVLTIAFLAAASFAAYNLSWTGGAGTTDWHTATNWETDGGTNEIPSGDTILHTGPGTIDMDADGESSKSQLGELGDAVLNINNGATWASNGWLTNGYKFGYTSTINIDGTINVSTQRTYLSNAGEGIINVNGGAFNLNGHGLYLGQKSTGYGILNLNSGSMYINGISGTYFFVGSYSNAWEINIDDGILTVNGDVTDFVATYADQFNPINGKTEIVAELNPFGQTVIYATPEPATFGLLGLGFAMLRKKK